MSLTTSTTSTPSGEVTVVRHADVEPATATTWPVNWSAIWVGVLSALALALIISLIGAAVGAHQLGPAGRIAKWSDVGLSALIFAVCGAFFSFVVGGWVAGKINGVRHAETDTLHGAIVWLVAVPILIVLAALGGGTLFGAWLGGLGLTPVWATQTAVTADPAAATAARNAALGAVATLLISLIGAVIGGWMASGEPMTLSGFRTRTPRARAHTVSRTV
jgi:VanZ family protein